MTRTSAVRLFQDHQSSCRALASEVAGLIREINEGGRKAVLGLATGRTPLPFYSELIRLHQEGSLSFREVVTFNLDEYLGLAEEHPESYHSFMSRELFSHVDIPPEQVHLPDGTLRDPAELSAHCSAYEDAITAAGGIDFQLLGIGRNGHIGFNEPGSPADSRTRVVALGPATREDAAASFGGLDQVPEQAVSMGCGTILGARKIVLLASGIGKAEIVKTALQGPVSESVTASFLQGHPDAAFYLDEAAASLL